MRSHELDPLSLVFGLIFALGGLAFLVLDIDVTNLHLDRVWPIALMAVGLVIVALSVRGARRGQEELPSTSDPEPADEP
jgi:drug/metabolite transporter (DMT)-like permease